MRFQISIFSAAAVLFTTLVRPFPQLAENADLQDPEFFGDSSLIGDASLIANSDTDNPVQNPKYDVAICCKAVDPDYATAQTCEKCGVLFFHQKNIALLDFFSLTSRYWFDNYDQIQRKHINVIISRFFAPQENL